MRWLGLLWRAMASSLLLGAPAAALAQSGAPQLEVTPLRGQTQQQQWSDRYACHDWAREQSGFDPTRESGGVAQGELTSRREQYRRALTACLKGRGYSVRAADTPQAPPAANAPPSPATLPPGGEQFSPRSEETHAWRVREFAYRPFAAQVEGGYSVTVGNAGDRLDNGWNVGLGLAWQPIRALPVSVRIDGSYSRFGETRRSLSLESQRYGTSIDWGHENLYGGDADVQLDLRMGPTVREYFFGGVGWYREQTVLGQSAWGRGLRCGFFCYPGYVPYSSTYASRTSGWTHSWNAGIGFEFALTPPGSFFIEARYLRLSPAGSGTAFVPIRFGLRF